MGMKFYSISGLDQLDEQALEAVCESWRRRVDDATGVVLLPNGVKIEHLPMIDALPGIKVIGDDQKRALSSHPLNDTRKMYVLEKDTSLYFKEHNKRKAFAILFMTDAAQWDNVLDGLEEIADKKNKETRIVMTPGCPRIFGDNQKDDWATICEDEQTRLVLYGNQEKRDVNFVFQGKWDKKYNAAQLHLVDAQFLQNKLTYCGDIDHVSWMSKELERKRKNCLVWDKHPDEKKDWGNPTLQFDTLSPGNERLYNLAKANHETNETDKPPSDASESTQKHVAQEETITYEAWIAFLKSLPAKSNLAYIKSSYQKEWQAYKEYFKVYSSGSSASKLTINSIIEIEKVNPQEKQEDEYDSWLDFLHGVDGKFHIERLEKGYPNQWKKYGHYMQNYKGMLVEDVIKSEQAKNKAVSPPKSVYEAMNLSLVQLQKAMPKWYDSFEFYLQYFDQSLSMRTIEKYLQYDAMRVLEEYLWELDDEGITFQRLKETKGTKIFDDVPALRLWNKDTTIAEVINLLMQYVDFLCTKMTIQFNDLPNKQLPLALTPIPKANEQNSSPNTLSKPSVPVNKTVMTKEFWESVEKSLFEQIDQKENIDELEKTLESWVEKTLNHKNFPKI